VRDNDDGTVTVNAVVNDQEKADLAADGFQIGATIEDHNTWPSGGRSARRGARSGGASHAAAETGATTEAANAFRAFRFGATAAAASGLTVNRVATRTYNVYWPFTGFTPRFGVRNQVQAGAGFPVTFALGANRGLAIFAAASRSRRCAAPATPAQSRRNRCTLRTGPTYTWKTLSAWKGTCRELVVTLSDNTEHRATFDQVAAMRGREEGAVAAAPSRGPRDVS